MYVGPFSFLSDLEHFREDKLEEQNKHKVKVAEFTQFAEWYKGFFWPYWLEADGERPSEICFWLLVLETFLDGQCLGVFYQKMIW